MCAGASFGEHVPAHRRFEPLQGNAGRKIEFCVKRVERKNVPVAGISRWARSMIGGLARAVAALERPLRKCRGLWRALGKLPRPRRQIVDDPVNERAEDELQRRIAIDYDERETRRLCRRRGPRQRR